MIFGTAFSLRFALTGLFLLTPLVALIIVGSVTLAVRLPQISKENNAIARASAAEMAARLEEYLTSLEDRLQVVASGIDSLSGINSHAMLEAARGHSFDAIYLLDTGGIVRDASVRNFDLEFTVELIGTDLSGNKLFQETSATGEKAWSDTQLSAITGIVMVGLAVPVPSTGQVIIGEVSLEQIVSISRFSRSNEQLDLWIVDRRGEIVADTNPTRSGRRNLLNVPIVRAGLNGTPIPDEISFDGYDYFAWAEFSESLGWLFVSRIPRGMDNATTRETVWIVAIGFIATSLLGVLLAPLWAQAMIRTISSVIDQARMIASGKIPEAWPTGPIKEFNQLSDDLEAMANALVSREKALKEINEELENRVRNRTRDLAASNAELSQALDHLRKTQGELVESERLAALGRLVAGVAHELNTPLGNSKLSLSAQIHEIENFSRLMNSGLKKSDLTGFVDRMRQGTSVAEMNVERACNLVSSFKQVAVDRTASYRRVFRLNDLISGTVLTLQPSISKSINVIVEEIPAKIELDSYPGEFGQVITNLVDNAVKHAFPDGAGTVRLTVSEPDSKSISVTIEDDGIGMTEDIADQIFNPFFTTKFGQGGTGLGLHISYNAVANVLGGTLSVTSAPGTGSAFKITVPLVAPQPDTESEPFRETS
jgi:signal transduction histidine kinase